MPYCILSTGEISIPDFTERINSLVQRLRTDIPPTLTRSIVCPYLHEIYIVYNVRDSHSRVNFGARRHKGIFSHFHKKRSLFSEYAVMAGSYLRGLWLKSTHSRSQCFCTTYIIQDFFGNCKCFFEILGEISQYFSSLLRQIGYCNRIIALRAVKIGKSKGAVSETVNKH